VSGGVARAIAGISVTTVRQINVADSSSSTYASTTPDTIAHSELDNHADTTCFGSNFTAISFTNQVCDVQPYSETYDAIKNIPIATAATAYDNPDTQETILLVFHQGLWFGDTLKRSLISPNQLRSYGVELCDDPWDPNRPLGMRHHDSQTFIRSSMLEILYRSPADLLLKMSF